MFDFVEAGNLAKRPIAGRCFATQGIDLKDFSANFYGVPGFDVSVATVLIASGTVRIAIRVCSAMESCIADAGACPVPRPAVSSGAVMERGVAHSRALLVP